MIGDGAEHWESRIRYGAPPAGLFLDQKPIPARHHAKRGANRVGDFIAAREPHAGVAEDVLDQVLQQRIRDGRPMICGCIARQK
jgi:hypothetical protein